MSRQTSNMFTVADGLDLISEYRLSDGLKRRVRQLIMEIREEAGRQNVVVELFADRRAS